MIPGKLNLGITIPGESLVVAIVNAISANRATMSQPNRDRLDKLFIDSLERSDKFWVALITPLVKALERLNVEEKPQ